jgi:hypothetical protein
LDLWNLCHPPFLLDLWDLYNLLILLRRLMNLLDPADPADPADLEHNNIFVAGNFFLLNKN